MPLFFFLLFVLLMSSGLFLLGLSIKVILGILLILAGLFTLLLFVASLA